MQIEVIAHNIRSLYNVGSIFRNCDGFGVAHLYLTGYTGTPPRAEISKVALGAEEMVPWSHTRDVKALIAELREEGALVLALESDDRFPPINKVPLGDRVVLVLGNEPDGIDAELLDVITDGARIPMFGQKSSLNVAVASGVALHALRSR